jgi:hypothetical protein
VAEQRGWQRYAAAGGHHADDDSPAAGGQRREGGLGERWLADGFHSDVDPALACHGGDHLREIVIGRVDDVGRAKSARSLAAVGLRVGGDDLCRAGDAGGLDVAEGAVLTHPTSTG